MSPSSRGLLRLARPEDAERVAAIYAPHVRDQATSFEMEPPSTHTIRDRIVSYLDHAPWLVCEIGGEVVGYAYGGKHRERLAYQWDIEVSVYVDARSQRLGIGRALYVALFRLLALQGFVNAYAGITLPNPPSVSLHESLGFTLVGIYTGAGYKRGAWHDVGWWQLALGPRRLNPQPPLTRADVSRLPEWDDALAAGAVLLKG